MRRFLESTPIRVEAGGLRPDLRHHRSGWPPGRRPPPSASPSTTRNIVHIEKNGQVLLDVPVEEPRSACGLEGGAPAGDGLAGRDLLTIADILDFAGSCSLEDIRPVLDTQIQYNTLISEEGLLGDYGANIGSTMLKFYGDDVRNRAIGQGGRRLRRPDERLRAAGGHQLGQRQPGHHGCRCR